MIEPTVLTTKAKTLLRDIARAFTIHHADLKTDGRVVGANLILTLQANLDDHPKLVGSQGKHIIALQAIFTAIGNRAGTPIRLTLLEPCKGEKHPLTAFVDDPEWKPDAIVKLLRRVLDCVTRRPYEIRVEDVGGMTVIVIVTDEFRAGDEMQRSLHAILHAIGKSQGRIIHVDAVAPDTATV